MNASEQCNMARAEKIVEYGIGRPGDGLWLIMALMRTPEGLWFLHGTGGNSRPRADRSEPGERYMTGSGDVPLTYYEARHLVMKRFGVDRVRAIFGR